jgi:hypothetical protein
MAADFPQPTAAGGRGGRHGDRGAQAARLSFAATRRKHADTPGTPFTSGFQSDATAGGRPVCRTGTRATTGGPPVRPVTTPRIFIIK